jgi:tetratricopeptide (TPR) repeat protein
VLLPLVDAYLALSTPQATRAQQAIDDARKAVPQLADDVDVLLAEANVAVVANQPRRAVESARKALAAAPDNAQLQQRYFDVLLRAGAHRDLLSESAKVLDKDRGAWWLYRMRGLAHRRLGENAEAAREFDAAFNLVSAAQNEQGLNLVVRTIAQESGAPEAIKRLEPVTKTDVAARMLLASLYQGVGEPMKALDLLERVKVDVERLRPDQRRQLLQSLGVAYLQVTPPAPEKAREAYEQLIKETPDDVLLLNNLAYVHTLPESGGRLSDALKYSTRAYELSQNLPSTDDSVLYVWDTHGWVLVLNNQLLDGLNILQRAAERAKFPEVFLHLAEAYMKNNELGRAQTALDEAGSIIAAYTSRKQPLDPSVRPRFERLQSDLQARSSLPPGAPGG